MKRLIQRPLSLPKPVVLVLAVVLVALIGDVDYMSGWELRVSVFYLIPITWVCWVVGRRAGVFLAVVSTVVWSIADFTTGYVYKHPTIPFWNALMLLVVFLVVVVLLSAFHDAHYRLEETVQQRTVTLQAEIAQRERLERAKLQAERLAAAGTMAAQVAHEIRNPLGSITLNLDLVGKELDQIAHTSEHPLKESRVLIRDIRDETGRIQRVINDYLRFSRPPKSQRLPVTLNELLDHKLAFLHATLEDGGVELQTEFDPALSVVNADAEQLWEVVLNLVRNGHEAMPKGGKLTVSTRREDAQAIVRVADTGSGMTEEQVRQMFAPFFSTKPEGTGLGLTIAQQIIIEHGGHIECASVPGKGSAFTIFLPLPEES